MSSALISCSMLNLASIGAISCGGKKYATGSFHQCPAFKAYSRGVSFCGILAITRKASSLRVRIVVRENDDAFIIAANSCLTIAGSFGKRIADGT